MSSTKHLDKEAVKQHYKFMALMIGGMVLGAILGLVSPKFGHAIKPIGTVFINMMFCVVVPLVFASIAGSVANMNSRARAGKIMGTTIVIFVATGIIAALVMFIAVKIFPPVLEPWTEFATEEIGEYASFSDMLVNFFTAPDFVGLLSRKAMLPLIVFSILFGFATSAAGGAESMIGKWLKSLTDVMMNFINIIIKFAPLAFFAIFADLLATYGSAVTKSYGRAVAVYYPLCFLYVLIAFPVFAYIGAGKDGVKLMFRHITRPVITSLGTCSSVACIPVNLEEASDTGIDDDIAGMVCPLGATMHMDGGCFSCIMKIAFVLGALGMEFEWSMLPMAILIAVLSSVGCSGVPGGGYIGEYIVASLFFPDQVEVAFPIMIAIGNLVDPPGTMINASGDYVVCFLVSRFVEGKDWLKKAITEGRVK